MASRNKYSSATNNQGGGDGCPRQFGGGWRAAGHTEACSWRCTEVHLAEKKDDSLRIPYPNSSQYAGGVSKIRPPRVLGCSSVDTDRNWSPGLSQLKFIKKQYLQDDGPIDVELDLNKGSEETKKNKVGFYAWNYEFYLWILNNIDTLRAPHASPPRLAADFVCMKHSVEWSLTAPCNLKRMFTIEARLFRGSIFLHAVEGIFEHNQELIISNEDHKKDVVNTNDSPEDPDNDTNESTDDEEAKFEAKLGVYGHKFHDYMIEGKSEKGADQNLMFVCQLELKVGGLTVIYPIKVHCADQHQFREDFEDLDAFVIIRSIFKVSSESNEWWYNRYQLQRFWTEGQMTGIPRTVVGFRDDAGVVHTVHNIINDNIPNMAQGLWRPEASVNFLADFLHYIKRKVEEQPDKYHRFIRDSDRVIRHMTATKEMVHHALPQWFLEELANKLDEGTD